MNKCKKWESSEIEYLKNNVNCMTIKDMSIKLGRTYDSVSWKIKDLGISNDTSWTSEEIEYLKKNFLILSKKQIAKELGRTTNAIQIKANKIGLKKPEKYFYNVDFFENIDTEEKAYWLGFIMADGYISQNEFGSEFGIELSVKDIEHLKKFNKSICGNIEVKTRDRWRNNIAGNDVNKILHTCSIRLYRNKIVEDLKKLGITNNKTTEINMPQIPDNLMIHLIRGYFDGDGCIMSTSRNSHSFDFSCASIRFLESLREYIYKHYNINSYICLNKKNIYNLPVYKLYIRGMTNAYKFGKLLYDNSNIHLDRKYELFNYITEKYNIVDRINKINKNCGD